MKRDRQVYMKEYRKRPGMRAILAEKARMRYWAKLGQEGCKGKREWRQNHTARLRAAEEEIE